MTRKVIGQSMRRYSKSCGLLLIPILIWNLAFARQLPPAYSDATLFAHIPAGLSFGENLCRFFVFVLPFLMPFPNGKAEMRPAIWLFSIGLALYFASWIPLLAWPESLWSTRWVGFIAPAYTPALWLFGLALLGRRLFWGNLFRWWMYLAISVLFLSLHITHATLVYQANY